MIFSRYKIRHNNYSVWKEPCLLWGMVFFETKKILPEDFCFYDVSLYIADNKQDVLYQTGNIQLLMSDN